MVMPISGVTAASSITSVAPTSATPAPTATDGFTDKIAGAMQSVSDSINQADATVQDVAAGGDTPIHEMMVAQTKAQLNTELLVQMRNKAVEAYQEIMRMQV
jgi:flagellar hook-basal body complex protein FliE